MSSSKLFVPRLSLALAFILLFSSINVFAAPKKKKPTSTPTLTMTLYKLGYNYTFKKVATFLFF